MRRFGRALAAIAIVVVSAVAVPSVAVAAEAPVLPDPIVSLPSDYGMPDLDDVLTKDEALLRKYQIQLGGRAASAGGALTRVGAVAKGAGGVPGAIATVGFAVVGGGVAGFWRGTGEYDRDACQWNEIALGAIDFLTFGSASPECTVIVPKPNEDTNALTWAGHTIQRVGVPKENTNVMCWNKSFSGFWTPDEKYRIMVMNSPGSIAWPDSGHYWCKNLPTWNPATGFMTAVRDHVVFLEGSEVAAQMDGNPPRGTRCTVDANGNKFSSEWLEYREAQGYPVGKTDALCTKAWADARAAGHTSIGSISLEGRSPSGEQFTMTESPVLDATRTNMQMYPNCYNGAELCQLMLMKTVGLDAVSCFTSPADCFDWFAKTDAATNAHVGADTRYDCRWGEYLVPLGECAIYQRAFPETSEKKGLLTDPKTGLPLRDLTGHPDTVTTPNTINPGVHVGTPAGECMATWLDDFNPIDWIMTPVKCALVWAFVPRQQVVTQALTGLQSRWVGTALGQWSGAIGGWSFEAPGSGCDGVLVPLSQVWPGKVADFRILEACAGQPLQPTADLSSLVLTLSAVLGLVVSGTRSIGGIVGYGGLSDGGTS